LINSRICLAIGPCGLKTTILFSQPLSNSTAMIEVRETNSSLDFFITAAPFRLKTLFIISHTFAHLFTMLSKLTPEYAVSCGKRCDKNHTGLFVMILTWKLLRIQ
jgi:hypothetical protein